MIEYYSIHPETLDSFGKFTKLQRQIDDLGYFIIESIDPHSPGPVTVAHSVIDLTGLLDGITIVIVGEATREEACEIADGYGMCRPDPRVNFFYKAAIE
jgi:hypothetical protein